MMIFGSNALIMCPAASVCVLNNINICCVCVWCIQVRHSGAPLTNCLAETIWAKRERKKEYYDLYRCVVYINKKK